VVVAGDRAGLLGDLLADLAAEGTHLEIEYLGERLSATVSAEPLWDPKGERLRS
jgi:glycine cleavage system aminomethyltransferase T